MTEEYLFVGEDFTNKCNKFTSFRYVAAPNSSSWISRIRKLKNLPTELANWMIFRQNFCREECDTLTLPVGNRPA